MINRDAVLDFDIVANVYVEINVHALAQNATAPNDCVFPHLAMLPDLGSIANRCLG
jgi:hypothetical protein